MTDPYIQKQMSVPIALSHVLPIGIKGLFVAIMIMGLLAGDAGHIHSWGSIFVQDVVMPLRRKPMSPSGHMWVLRFGVIGVASFALLFSYLFNQSQYITLWMALTAGVFVGGAGVAIIGGLYTRWGTTAGAWAGALAGCSLSLVGVALTTRDVWKHVGPMLHGWGIDAPAKFWLNGQQVAFIAAICAVTMYTAVSLLTTRRKRFDLNAMLHRKPDEPSSGASSIRRRFRLANILRFDAQFTRTDRWASGGIFVWSMLLLGVNLAVSLVNLRAWYPTSAPFAATVSAHWPEPWGAWGWAHYWAVTAIGIPFAIAVVTLIWFGIGGIADILDFFRTLKTMRRDARDDGRVIGAQAAITVLETSASALNDVTNPSRRTKDDSLASKG